MKLHRLLLFCILCWFFPFFFFFFEIYVWRNIILFVFRSSIINFLNWFRSYLSRLFYCCGVVKFEETNGSSFNSYTHRKMFLNATTMDFAFKIILLFLSMQVPCYIANLEQSGRSFETRIDVNKINMLQHQWTVCIAWLIFRTFYFLVPKNSELLPKNEKLMKLGTNFFWHVLKSLFVFCFFCKKYQVWWKLMSHQKIMIRLEKVNKNF